MFLETNYLTLKADYKVGLPEVQFDNYHPAPAFVRQGQGDILFLLSKLLCDQVADLVC
jgi:hypothetical protein